MNLQARVSRWVPAVSVAAVSIAALGAVAASWWEKREPAVAQRPAPDASVEVVRVPASAPAGERPACRTCVLGNKGSWL